MNLSNMPQSKWNLSENTKGKLNCEAIRAFVDRVDRIAKEKGGSFALFHSTAMQELAAMEAAGEGMSSTSHKPSCGIAECQVISLHRHELVGDTHMIFLTGAGDFSPRKLTKCVNSKPSAHLWSG